MLIAPQTWLFEMTSPTLELAPFDISGIFSTAQWLLSRTKRILRGVINILQGMENKEVLLSDGCHYPLRGMFPGADRIRICQY
jgi:hypothetical protein